MGNQQTTSIIGQDRALRLLEATLRGEVRSSSFLFYGPSSVGKRSTARLFLQAALCEQRSGITPCGSCTSCTRFHRGNHPDVVTLESEAPGIDDIRGLQQKLRFRPSIGPTRVSLIGSADGLTIEASNALLKTLEEPLPNTLIVLCTTALDLLPPTVRSRCQLVEFRLVSSERIEEALRRQSDDTDRCRDISSVAMGRPGLAFRLLTNPEEYASYRERIERLFSVLQAPISERLRFVHELLPSRAPAKEVRDQLTPLLDLWMWILRDAALLQHQNPEFLVHRFLDQQLLAYGRKIPTQQIVRNLRLLERTKFLLKRYVNPTLLLEHCVLHL